MRNGKKLFSFVEVTDDTPIQKLTVLEQLRLLIRRMANDDKEQLRAEDAETVYQLQLKANLLEFLIKATEKVRQGEEKSVTCQISSKFNPVLEEVLQSPSIANYYTATVVSPDIDFDVDYFIKVKLEVKSY